MFIQRLLSGIVMLAMVFFGIWIGDWLWWGMVFALSIVGMYEMYKALEVNENGIKWYGYIWVGLYYIIIMPVLFNLCIVRDAYVIVINTPFLIFALLIIGILIAMAIYVFTFPEYNYSKIFELIIGAIYPGFLLGFLYLIRMQPGGLYLVWLVFIAAWGSDTFAYCTGMICKKFFTTHKMAPILSPKKSVEGGVGGIFFATLLGGIYGIVFMDKIDGFSISVPMACAILSFVGAMISMVGDLAASAIKRNKDIKDYGKLIPGHGGIMDRFDSIIFAAPCIYFAYLIIQMFAV